MILGQPDALSTSHTAMLRRYPIGLCSNTFYFTDFVSYGIIFKMPNRCIVFGCYRTSSDKSDTACQKKKMHVEMRHFDKYMFNIFHSILYDLQDY